MKIAIIGTRGIPNNYGGFEQLAQFLSIGLFQNGHDVYVYSSHKHPYKQKKWQGINIIHKYCPENFVGSFGQFIYDLNCIWDSRNELFDVVINLGYTSSSIWLKLFPPTTFIITNMDGLEWKRTKYNKFVRKFLMYAEKKAVKNSHLLVADSIAIKNYLEKKYSVQAEYIAYGADLFVNPNIEYLLPFKATAYQYNILVARMEPENNIELILDGVVKSSSKLPFYVVGNTKNKFGTYLLSKYSNENRIVFTGPIYDYHVINNLRYFSNLYFHGHSVGGTNPSLLESMACGCLIAAHNNEFNRSVLNENAYYFQNSDEIKVLLESVVRNSEQNKNNVENNYIKVKTDYSWAKIVRQYEEIVKRR